MLFAEDIPKRFLFLDIETTGVSPGRDRITEIGALVYEDGKIVRRYETLINPEVPIPQYIITICGITDEMVKDAPLFQDVAEELMELAEGRIFVAHNVSFDYGFIRAEYERTGIEFNLPRLCTVQLSRKLFPAQRKHNLDAVMERMGLQCSRRHRALDDAQVICSFFDRVRKERKHGFNEVLKGLIR